MFRWLHWIGVACILISAILLLITTISSPVIGDIGILKVMLTNQTHIRHSSVTFGTFGHCVLDVAPVTTDQDFCYPKAIGYKPAAIMSQIDGTSFSRAGTDTADALTNAFILHPVACGLAFIAGFCAFGGLIGSLVGTMIAIVAWLITVVVMAIDFAVFAIIKKHVNRDGSGSHAYYSVGMWTCLAAMILLLIGTIIVFFTCCTERRRKSRGATKEYRESKHSHRRRSVM
ncbi:pali-domain-containing protein [Lophium mytilinum]|uniref:Pali-domain-containing protein n=1 Tax=Lophium mytilinum TaxID=390894 RepID=A0A6A6QN89_9PEZI|nr:pali-domain-containing protein [Lophium mytilinum]